MQMSDSRMRMVPAHLRVGLPPTLNVELPATLRLRDTYLANLFLTPTSCGLLTGVFAGGVMIWWQLTALNAREPMPGQDFCFDYLAMLCLCGGAVLSRRKLSLIPHVLILAAVATCMDLSMEWLELYGHVAWTFTSDPFVAYSVSSALSGAFLGLVLALTYDSRRLVLSCVGLGLLGQLLTFAILYFQERAGRQGGPEQAAQWFIPVLLTYMVSATLPALAIDRAWRARKRGEHAPPLAASKN